MPQKEQTLEQKRAEHALKIVRGLIEQPHGKFRSHADSLPAAIVMNGLGQAMAFELSKKEEDHKALYGAVQSWLCETVYTGEKNLMDAIVNYGQDHYVRAQAEALAYLEWLKKFSRAYL